MDPEVILLSGTPASGKDSVTRLLCKADEAFILFKKHRGVAKGTDNKEEYTDISLQEFKCKAERGDFVQYHSRYGRMYGVEAKRLRSYIGEGKYPVIHVGRINNYVALAEALRKNDIRFCHILIWSPLVQIAKRLAVREKGEEQIKERYSAAQEEFVDIAAALERGEKPYDVVILNVDVKDTAARILNYIRGERTDNAGYEGLEKYLRENSKAWKI